MQTGLLHLHCTQPFSSHYARPPRPDALAQVRSSLPVKDQAILVLLVSKGYLGDRKATFRSRRRINLLTWRLSEPETHFGENASAMNSPRPQVKKSLLRG